MLHNIEAMHDVAPQPTPMYTKKAPLTPVTVGSAPTPPPPNGRLVISIEGNIGIGKSTLLENLRKQWATDPRVIFVQEPVALWEENGLLEAMYSNTISRCAFQLMALTTRYTALQKALESDATVIITERSVHSDRYCFAAVNLDSEPDKAAYAATHDALIAALPADLRIGMVYLQAPREVLNQRIASRGRAAETENTTMQNPDGTPAADQDGAKADGGIPDEYLAKLDAAHAHYFTLCEPTCKQAIDATATPEAVAASVVAAIERIDADAPVSPHPRNASPVGVMDSMDLI
jgi:deoxyadenosine/deoxycytidine kinase